MPRPVRHLLLTGPPGVGKTTVIRRVAESLPRERLGGFYTEEIRQAGERRGFRLLGFNGRQWLIAHVDLPKRHRIGKYGVDVAAIDAAVEELLLPTPEPDIYLIDEIGKMECLSARFVEVIRQRLQGDKTVVATVGKRGGGAIDEVKRRVDCRLWEITRENRDRMLRRVLRWLENPM